MNRIFLFTNLLTIILLVFATQLISYFSEVTPEYPNHVHKTLLLDRQLDSEEVIFITQAAWEWTEATNHIVEIDVVQLPNKEELLNEDAILVMNASPDYPNILIQEAIEKKIILGLYTKQNGLNIIELVSERITDKQYKEVILHELGHALGLPHNEENLGMDTLMSPYIEFGTDHITQTDLDSFCKLYHCHLKN